MIEILLSTTLIIAISMAFLCIKVFLKRGGSFSSQHIHDNEGMKVRGIHCVMDQDREARDASYRARMRKRYKSKYQTK